MSDDGRSADDVRVDTAQDTDVEGIVSVERDCWLATYPNAQAKVAADDVRTRFIDTTVRKAAITHDLLDSRHRYVVARLDNHVIGYCHLLKEPSCNHVVELYLLPNYQKRGLGRQLMDNALQWLDNEKPIQVEIVAYNTNALGFYKTFGFVVDPTRRQSAAEDWNVLPSGTRLPVVFMVKQHGGPGRRPCIDGTVTLLSRPARCM